MKDFRQDNPYVFRENIASLSNLRFQISSSQRMGNIFSNFKSDIPTSVHPPRRGRPTPEPAPAPVQVSIHAPAQGATHTAGTQAK